MSLTPQPSSSTPSAVEVIQKAMAGQMADVHTAMPGTIHSFDQGTQTASVQLGLMRKYQSENQATPYPILTKVPVAFPAVKNGWLRLPITVGDTGLVVFGERSIDNWLDAGGQQDPEQGRRFSIADAIFIPGLTTAQAPTIAKGEATSLEIYCGGARVEITASGKFRITNGTADLLAVLDSILTNLSTLSTVGGPTAQVISPASIADFAIDQVQLGLLMP